MVRCADSWNHTFYWPDLTCLELVHFDSTQLGLKPAGFALKVEHHPLQIDILVESSIQHPSSYCSWSLLVCYIAQCTISHQEVKHVTVNSSSRDQRAWCNARSYTLSPDPLSSAREKDLVNIGTFLGFVGRVVYLVSYSSKTNLHSDWSGQKHRQFN